MLSKIRKIDKRRSALNDNIIVQEYLSGQSIAKIAKNLKCSKSSITRRLNWNNVRIRTVNESCAYFRNKSFLNIAEIQNMFDGLLLGDAWIECDGKSEGRLAITQCDAHLDWLVSIKKCLDFYNIKNTLIKTKNRGWLLRTGKYVNFTQLRQEWYPDGKKIVPKKLQLTSITLAHWIWGDGTLTNSGYTYSLCTDGFSETDVDLLIELLQKDLDIVASKYLKEGKYWRINVYRKCERIKILNYIQDFCPPCFQYKLDTKQ